jgi:hypothetical protein
MKAKFLFKVFSDILIFSCFIGFVFLASAIDQAQAASVPTQSVRVSNSPTVFIAPNQTVSVSGTQTVSVSGTPTVSVTGTPTVSVTGTPTVSVTAYTGTDKGSGATGASTLATIERVFAGSISQGNISIGTTAARASVSGSAPATTRKIYCISNLTSTAICSLGGSGLTAGTTGTIIPWVSSAAGATSNQLPLCFYNVSTDFYARCSAAATTLTVMEVY